MSEEQEDLTTKILTRDHASAGGGASVEREKVVAKGKAAKSITPQKWQFHWYTIPSWVADFVKGEALGMGEKMGSWARAGWKLGLAAGCVAFFAPVSPLIASVAPMAVANGLMAFVDVAIYAGAGAALGAAGGAAMGLMTGGAHEWTLRNRREKYAQELAERNEMRVQQKAPGKPLNHWREYDAAYKDFRRAKDLRYHFLGQNASTSWTDYVENRPSYQHARGGL